MGTTEKNIIFIGLILLFVVLPACFILMWIQGLLEVINRIRKCTEPLYAEVVPSYSMWEFDDDPYFSYTYEGVDYKEKYLLESRTHRGNWRTFYLFKAGSQVKIYVDPNAPKTMYCPKKNISIIITNIFLLSIVTLALFFIIK